MMAELETQDAIPEPSALTQAVAADMANLEGNAHLSDDIAGGTLEPDIAGAVAADMEQAHEDQFGTEMEADVGAVLDSLLGGEQVSPEGFVESQPIEQLGAEPTDLDQPFEGETGEVFADDDGTQPEQQQAEEQPAEDPMSEQLKLTQEQVEAVKRDPNLMAVAQHMHGTVQQYSDQMQQMHQNMQQMEAAAQNVRQLQQSLATPEGVQHLIRTVLSKPMGENTVAAAMESMLMHNGQPSEAAPEFLLNVALAMPDLWEQTTDRFEELNGDQDKLALWQERQRVAARERHVQAQLHSLHEQNSRTSMARLESHVRAGAKRAGLWDMNIDTMIEALPRMAHHYADSRTGEIRMPQEAIDRMVYDSLKFQQALEQKYTQEAAQRASQKATQRTRQMAQKAQGRMRQAPRPSATSRRDLNRPQQSNRNRPATWEELIDEAQQQREISRSL